MSKAVTDLLNLTLKGEMPHARDWQNAAVECSLVHRKIQGTIERAFRWREVASLQWAERVAGEAIVVSLATEKRKLLALLADQTRQFEDED